MCTLLCSGKDATEDFEEIGHSNAAREMLDKYYIGEFDVSSTHVYTIRAARLPSCLQCMHCACREGNRLQMKPTPQQMNLQSK